MDSFRHIQAPSAVPRKEKKKQAKDEIDRLKQAEKKKRRLEKALATSAAIRSELEKKKQKKKEEQERLDEEGAAISEAVALHVLLGEDTDESCQAMLNNNKSCNLLDHSSNIGLFMDCQSFTKYSVEEIGWVSDAYGSAHRWSDWDKRSLSRELHLRELQSHFYEDATQGTEISAGLVAAQAVSTLRIAENSQNDVFTGQKAATVVINRMLGGNDSWNKVNRYKYF